MFGRLNSKSSFAVLLVVALLWATVTPALAENPLTPPSGFEVSGKVLGKDGSPAEGVIVLAYHLGTEQLFTATTDPKAEFRLTNLPNGYYDFAARSVDGFYVGDQVASVSPSGQTKLELRLRDYENEQNPDRWYFPGAEDKPTGVAQLQGQDRDGPSFWAQRPSAKYVIGGGGALLLLALGGGGGGSGPTESPFTP